MCLPYSSGGRRKRKDSWPSDCGSLATASGMVRTPIGPAVPPPHHLHDHDGPHLHRQRLHHLRPGPPPLRGTREGGGEAVPPTRSRAEGLPPRFLTRGAKFCARCGGRRAFVHLRGVPPQNATFSTPDFFLHHVFSCPPQLVPTSRSYPTHPPGSLRNALPAPLVPRAPPPPSPAPPRPRLSTRCPPPLPDSPENPQWFQKIHNR